MSKRRILVTGSSGFLGWNLLQRPWPDCDWIGCSHRHNPEFPSLRNVCVDLTQPGTIDALLDSVQPDVLLHMAAATNLPACEANPTDTQRINVEVPSILARGCAKRNIYLLVTSSDMVFDGRHPPYQEENLPCPINMYGRQKAEAEARVLAACPNAAICRMPLMFGTAGPWAHNFLPEWIGKLTQRQAVTLFTDEFRAPVSAATACEGLRLAVERGVSGILHLGGRERLSRYDFGQLLCQVWGFESELLHPARRDELDLATERPADTFLDSHRAWEWGYAQAPIEAQLRTLRQEAHVL